MQPYFSIGESPILVKLMGVCARIESIQYPNIRSRFKAPVCVFSQVVKHCVASSYVLPAM